MRSRLFQALLGCTARATRPRPLHAVCTPTPPMMTFVPPLACEPLSPFVRGAQAPLVVRAAILSQARCLHLTPALCTKRRKKNTKVKDDCSGRTERRRRGFNKSCPPPPPICPPCSTKRHHKEECEYGFGSKKKNPRKHGRDH